MRISLVRLAFSLLLCTCLLGCGQIKEGVCAVSDGRAAADAAAGSAGGLKGGEAAPEAYVGGGCCPNPEPAPPDNSKSGVHVFSLRDKDTDILVESYSLPRAGRAAGRCCDFPRTS